MMVAWIELEDEEGTISRWRIEESDPRFQELEKAISTPDTVIL